MVFFCRTTRQKLVSGIQIDYDSVMLQALYFTILGDSSLQNCNRFLSRHAVASYLSPTATPWVNISTGETSVLKANILFCPCRAQVGGALTSRGDAPGWDRLGFQPCI